MTPPAETGSFMTMISNEIRRIRTPDGGILLDIEGGRMFCLNVVGFEILELLVAGVGQAQIIEQIGADYGMDPDTVRTDVHNFLKTLDQKNILAGADPTKAPDTSPHVG
jgi:hypothetical protein